MMKRIAGVVVVLSACLLMGCDGAPGQATGEAPAPAAGTPESILEAMQADFDDTAQGLYDEQTAMFEKVGSTYEDYLENEQLVQDWYDLAVSETVGLGERTLENSKSYFQAVIDTVDVEDGDALEDAIDAYYEAIYDDAYDDYYDAIYEDAFDEAYDAYYDGIISDEFKTTDDWDAVYDVSSDAYDACSDARSDVYDAISDARSDVYDVASDARSAMYGDEFSMDEIFRESVVNIEKTDASAEEATEASAAAADGSAESRTQQASDTASEGVSADFKKTMDSYEAFFDEYVEFMKTYADDPSDPGVLAEYPDVMDRYTEAMENIDSIDAGSLSSADYAYYAEVTARIYGKIAAINQKG